MGDPGGASPDTILVKGVGVCTLVGTRIPFIPGKFVLYLCGVGLSLEAGNGLGQDALAPDAARRRFLDIDEEIRYFHTLVLSSPLGGNVEVVRPDHVEDQQGKTEEDQSGK
jgi:hypothetical protein